MATAAAELFVRVGVDIRGLISGFGAAAKAADGLGKSVNTASGNYIDANGRMRAANGRFVASANQATGAAGELAGGLGGLKTAAAGVGLLAVAGGIAMVGQRAITLAAELEQAKIGFTTMLGGAQQADKFLRDLTQFAATTPFELRGLVDSSKRLLAFGFEAQGVIPIMTAVGNAVAGLGGGKEVLDGVTLALGQMAAKGKVSAEEMNQLAERGIPAWKMLAKEIGVSQPQAMKMAEKGAIDANTAIVSIINGMNQEFPDMMSKQSKSFSGAMSNLQDSADIALTKIGTAIIEAFHITPIIQALSAVIGELTEAISERGLKGAVDSAGRAFVEMGAASKVVVLGLASAFASVAVPAVVTFGTAAVSAIVSATLAFAPMLAAVTAVAAGAYVIIRNWDLIRDAVWYAMDNASQAVQGLRNAIVRQFNDVRGIVNDAMMYIGLLFRETFGDRIANALGVGLAKAGGYVSRFSETATTHLSGWAKSTSGSMSAAARSALEGARDIGSVLTDSVRYAMDDVSSQLTVGYSKAAGIAKDATGKVTAEMLGLKAAAQQATGAASKKAKALKAAEVEARKAEAAFARLTKVNQQAYDRFEAMAMALGKLGAALREVDAQAASQGRSFDVAGARAKAYKENLSAIESAFGKFSVQAVNARAELERFTAASVNGGAATAQAYGVIDQASTALANQSFAAKVLGKEWDATAEGIKSAEGVLVSLIDKGLRPGNAAYDEAAQKLAKVKAALDAKQASLTQVASSMGDVFNATNSLLGNLGTLAESFGITGAAAAIKFAQAGVQAAIALAQIPSAIAAVGTALQGLSALFVTNPILAAILAITGAVVIAGTAMYQWWQSTQEEVRKTTEEMRKAEEEAQRVRDGIQNSLAGAFRQAGKDFLNNVAEWGDNLRAALRDNVINGIFEALISGEMMKNLADLRQAVIDNAGDPMSEAFKKAVKALGDGITAETERLKPVFQALDTMVSDVLPAARTKVAEGTAAISAARASRSTPDVKVDKGAIETLRTQQRHYLDELTRISNMAGGRETAEYAKILARANEISDWIRKLQSGKAIPATFADSTMRSLAVLPEMANGGLVKSPTVAIVGEGRNHEAVLPLNESVYRQIGAGIAASGKGEGGMVVNVNYTGNGKWTREDAQGLGRLLVSELRTMGVRA